MSVTMKDYLQGAKDFRLAAIKRVWAQPLYKPEDKGKTNPWYFDKKAIEDLLRSIPLEVPIPKDKEYIYFQ